MVDVKTLATECRNKVLAKQLIDIVIYGVVVDFHYGMQKLLLILLLLSLLTESAVIIGKI